MNIKNLITLADYLYNLPDDYERFEMKFFYCSNVIQDIIQPQEVNRSRSCGTAACAIGHIPNALPEEFKDFIKEYRYLNWYGVSEYVLEMMSYNKYWEFLFGAEWTEIDNTPKGAAKRIYYVLAGEDPCLKFTTEHYKGVSPSDVDHLREGG